MKCDCGCESDSWMHIGVYEHNIKVGKSKLCTKCAYTYMLSNLMRIKEEEPIIYAEIKKAAMKYKGFEDKGKRGKM